MKFGEHIKQLREQNHLLQRQLANALDMDSAMLSKIERGERRAKREHIPVLASQLRTNEKELFTIWLADQVYELIKEEENATEILRTVGENINNPNNKHLV
jgi:transcriptional regulator with XRE-family HTH domain